MGFLVLFCSVLVLCYVGQFAHAIPNLSEEQYVTETCCTVGQKFSVTASAVQQCNKAAVPEDIEPEDMISCLAGIRSCCERHFQLKEECMAGTAYARARRCNVPKTDLGKTCCEECSIGRWTGESQGKEACGAPFDEFASPTSALRKMAYYQCCVKAAEAPTTTEALTTTPKKPETTTTPKEKCMANSCEHTCDDEMGRIKCSCREGFRLQADKKSCRDINECAEAVEDLCTAEGTVCHNIPGSFKCVPLKKREINKLSCPPGFKRNVENQVCDDINECQSPRPPCPKYLCENTIGGYKCAGKPGKPYQEAEPGGVTEPPEGRRGEKNDNICPPGFRSGPGDECLDIDECEEHSDDCQRLSQHCINIHGAFFCQDHVSKRCPPGFRVNKATGVCEDIDECEESSEVCQRTEICVNMPGAYTCKSKISTLPKLGSSTTCEEGTRARLGSSGCEDIDECREGSHLCDQFQNCINTYGGHECQCKNGFELDSSGSCVDVDECALKMDNCRSGTYCLNTVGTYTCTRAPVTSSTALPTYDYEYYDSNEDNSTTNNETSDGLAPKPTLPSVVPAPTRPVPATSKPLPITSRPLPTTSRPHPTTSRPHPTTSRPLPTTSRPVPTTSRPVPTTSTPLPTTRSSKQRPYTNGPRRIPRPTASKPSPTVTEPSTTPKPRVTPARSRPRPTQEHRPENRPTTPYIYHIPEKPENNRPQTPDSNILERPEYNRRIRPESRPYYRPEYRPYENQPSRPDVRPTEVEVPRPNNPVTIEKEKDPEGVYDIDTSNIPKDRWTNVIGTHRDNNPKPDSFDRPEKPGNNRPTRPESRPAYNRSDNESRTDFDPNELHCLNGYEKNAHGRCVDINECESDRYLCSSAEVCENRPGGYVCECKAGFTRNITGWCERAGYTTTSTVPPSPPLPPKPSDTPRPYSPHPTPSEPHICELGYTYNSKAGQCVDIDECATGKANCSHDEDCANHDGGYRCICGRRCETELKPSYVLPPRQPTPDSHVFTVGTDYGQRGPNYLQPTITRYPTAGAFCPWGYKLTPNKMCFDIDECAQNVSRCGPQQRCENFYGGHSCQCPEGHRLLGSTDCEDIDECRYGLKCPFNSKCVNLVGSYRCACAEGFRNAPHNNKMCVDIDECAEKPGACEQGCANGWGGYRCYCQRGYRLNTDNRTCVDVDECAEWGAVRLRGRLCGGECVNELGSYRCACPGGYRLSGDGRSCIDIDECETGIASCAHASAGEVCQNTRGGYHCHKIDCPPGYQLESKHRCSRIQRQCPVWDWKCLQQPSSYSYNFITFVANIFLPKGSVDLFTMHGPAWQDAEVTFEMQMVNVKASPSVKPLDLNCFDMRPTNNICVVSLQCSPAGPQVAELELAMSLRRRGQFAGSAVARLVVIVSQYDF